MWIFVYHCLWMLQNVYFKLNIRVNSLLVLAWLGLQRWECTLIYFVHLLFCIVLICYGKLLREGIWNICQHEDISKLKSLLFLKLCCYINVLFFFVDIQLEYIHVWDRSEHLNMKHFVKSGGVWVWDKNSTKTHSVSKYIGVWILRNYNRNSSLESAFLSDNKFRYIKGIPFMIQEIIYTMTK